MLVFYHIYWLIVIGQQKAAIVRVCLILSVFASLAGCSRGFAAQKME